MLTLAVARLLPAGTRALRVLRGAEGADRAARVLAVAVRALPPEQAAWGAAMLAELGEARTARARRHFSRGCIRAVIAMRIRAAFSARDRGGVGVRAVVLGAVAAAVALAVYGPVRYPGLRAGADAWAAGAVLLALLLAYAACALTLSRGSTPQAAGARRNGLLGGVAVGVAWLAALSPVPLLKAWVLLPLLAALVVPAGVAFLTARASRDVRCATGAALWSGIVGGVLVFVVWLTAAYVSSGGPYDRQLVRDFHRSGMHDLATYAVSDDIGAALGLLVIVPTVALALGSLAVEVARRAR